MRYRRIASLKTADAFRDYAAGRSEILPAPHGDEPINEIILSRANGADGSVSHRVEDSSRR